MVKHWVELGVQRGTEVRFYTGQVTGSVEDAIFKKQADEFVRLDRVRWLECESDHHSGQSEWGQFSSDDNSHDACELVVVRNESLPEQYDHHIYFKKSNIIMVTPIRNGATVWEDRRSNTGGMSYSISLDVPGSSN